MNILITLTEYKAKKAKLDASKEEIESLTNDIVKYMGNEKKITVGQYVATITECTKNTLDEKAIRAELPDVANKYNRVTEYTRFTVK